MKTLLILATTLMALLVLTPNALGQQVLGLDGRWRDVSSSLPNGVYFATDDDGVLQKVVVIDGRMLNQLQLPKRHVSWSSTAVPLGNGDNVSVSLTASKRRIRLNEDTVMTINSSVGQKLRAVIANMPCDGHTPLVAKYLIILEKGDPVEIGRFSFQRSIICTPIIRLPRDPIYQILFEDGTSRRVITENVADVLPFFDVKKGVTVNGTSIWSLGQDWPHKPLTQKWMLFAKLDVKVELRGTIINSLVGQSPGVNVIVFRK